MLPWVQLASAIAPDGDTLRLMRRGDEFSIRLQGGNELMNSRLGGSEEALATLALDRLADDAVAPQGRRLRLLAKLQGALAGHSWLWR